MKQWTKPKLLPLPLKGLIPLWKGATHPMKLLHSVVIALDAQEGIAEIQGYMLSEYRRVLSL